MDKQFDGFIPWKFVALKNILHKANQAESCVSSGCKARGRKQSNIRGLDT